MREKPRDLFCFYSDWCLLTLMFVLANIILIVTLDRAGLRLNVL